MRANLFAARALLTAGADAAASFSSEIGRRMFDMPQLRLDPFALSEPMFQAHMEMWRTLAAAKADFSKYVNVWCPPLTLIKPCIPQLGSERLEQFIRFLLEIGVDPRLSCRVPDSVEALQLPLALMSTYAVRKTAMQR